MDSSAGELMDLQGLKYLVVGAGFYGAVTAERIAEDLGERVLVIDRRDHIGGNSFSYRDPETGIDIHKYGSHIFHTSNEKVWSYLQRFTHFNNYRHRVLTRHNGRIFTMPINLDTINSFFGQDLTPEQAERFIAEKVSLNRNDSPANLEEKAKSLIGEELYNAFIRGYTQKQWETEPTALPANIITRLPFRFNYNDFYFNDVYEGIPKDGYGRIFENMLNHRNIEVNLNIDFFEMRSQIPKDCTVIYTGPIDKYFEYKFGKLGWRTTDFEWQRHTTADVQGTSVINYPDLDVTFTRIHEFKHFQPERLGEMRGSITAKEYSRFAKENDVPYYPINTSEDKATFARYRELAEKEPNVVFGGRLGNYVYVDMHQAIAMALNNFEQLKRR